jgi:restriction system protein
MKCNFPDVELIENSRINFTSPKFTKYKNLFSKRQQVALIAIQDAIRSLPNKTINFFEDAFLSMLHLGKYIDYRSKSQDNHCPSNRLKETNLYNRFIEKLKERKKYINAQNYDTSLVTTSNRDYKDFLADIKSDSISLILTDPPYGDNAQYFEHAQRVHPFMNYTLKSDTERLRKEVVISNAKERIDKHGKEQFLADIEYLFKEAYRVISRHGFFVLYFRPEQRDWISDLNTLKHFGRKHGFEPLITIPIDNTDPSMRVLASAAWTFKNDVCFIFYRLDDSERRWYEENHDVDELIYLAASAAATDQGNPFVIAKFNTEVQSQFRKCGLVRLLSSTHTERIQRTLDRYAKRIDAQYRLTGLSPYNLINKEMNAEIRLREFAPVVIEELTANGKGFTFEEYVIHLASYMENGSREIIEKLHTANRLIPELLNLHAIENTKEGKFFAKAIFLLY